jgi:4-methyl-5(b-hydroxyethyl)-thiazole monophosphate biosynthesis
MKRVIVPLATGFEEIEAVVVIDILRRARCDVVVAGVDGRTVAGSHDIRIECDCVLDDYDVAGVDAVVLPGGLPGTDNLGRSDVVKRLLAAVNDAGGVIGAICASPTVLNAVGLLDGMTATCHPAHEGELDHCAYSSERVVTDGNIVTSRGAGTAVEFAAELTRLLVGEEAANEILRRIVHR